MCGGAIISDFIPPQQGSDNLVLSVSDLWPDSDSISHPNPPTEGVTKKKNKKRKRNKKNALKLLKVACAEPMRKTRARAEKKKSTEELLAIFTSMEQEKEELMKRYIELEKRNTELMKMILKEKNSHAGKERMS